MTKLINALSKIRNHKDNHKNLIKKNIYSYIKKQDLKFFFINNWFNTSYNNNKFSNKTIIGSIKSNFLILNQKVNAMSKILKNLDSCYNSTFIKHLLTNTNITILYNTVQDEFAMGALGIYSSKIAINPWIKNCPTGGSSSGSSVAIATVSSDFSIGSDTGGSIRVPAALCGIIGFKPSYGAISRRGLITFSSLLDTVGILTRNLKTLKNIFSLIAKPDSNDMTSIRFYHHYDKIIQTSIYKNYLKNKKQITIGIIQLNNKSDPIIQKKFNLFIKQLKNLNYKTILINNYYFDKANRLYNPIAYSESVFTLNRYILNNIYINNSNIKFGPEVQNRLKLGEKFLKTKEYHKSLKKLLELYNSFNNKYQNIDFFIYPTLNIDIEHLKIQNKRSEIDYYNVLANMLQRPAITLPIKFLINNKFIQNKFFSIQIMGKKYYDYKLLEFSKKLIENIPDLCKNKYELFFIK